MQGSRPFDDDSLLGLERVYYLKVRLLEMLLSFRSSVSILTATSGNNVISDKGLRYFLS